MKNDLFILTLLNLPRVGRKTVSHILDSVSEFSTDENDILDILKGLNNINKRIKVPTIDEIKLAKENSIKILRDTEKLGIGILTISDEDYPRRLKLIENPPVMIFYKGNKKCLSEEKSVAIIGTRKPTLNGIKVARRLGNIFSQSGFTIVSGLAKGCDENAHIGCLEVKGQTVAVLPSGLDNIYPESNKDLAKQIINNNGCLVSEYPIGVSTFKNHFIERDRIESALSKAVIVVETDIKSGTMYTVDYAKKQSKLLAVYRPLDKYINLDELEGNRVLMNDKNNIILDSAESIEQFKDLIVNKKEGNRNGEQLKFI